MAASSTQGSAPSIIQILIIEAILALWILVRSIRTYQGRVVSVARLFAFPVLTGLLWVLAEGETAITIPWSFPLWTAIDVVVLVGAALLTVPFAGRLVRVYRGSDQRWMYRYGIELIAFYLGVWFVRLALAVYYDPSSLYFTIGPAPALTGTAAIAMQTVQGLFSVSSGLVAGRSAVTYRLYRAAQSAPPPSSAPLA
jgi:hypothetical protein